MEIFQKPIQLYKNPSEYYCYIIFWNFNTFFYYIRKACKKTNKTKKKNICKHTNDSYKMETTI